MAQKTSGSQRSGSRRSQGASSRRSQSTAARNGKRASTAQSRKSDGETRPAQQALRETTDSEREYRHYMRREEHDPSSDPDVVLDVPEVRVDLIHLEVDNLDAHVALKANVLNLVKLNVGIDVHLRKVKLDIKGVEAELVMKARLDHVAAIVDRLMTSLDRNPELVKGLTKAVAQIGQGAGEAVGKTGDAAKDIGQGAQSALKDVGQGAGEATGDIGQGAGQAVGDVGHGAGQAVGDVGHGAGQAVGDVGHGAGQAVGDVDQLVGGVGQTLGQAGQGAGQALGGVEQTVGQAGQAVGGAGQALGGKGQNGGGAAQGQPGGGAAQAQPDGAAAEGQPNGAQSASPGTLAKEVAKVLARQLGHAASDEARDLSLAATRKVRELGERREQRRAEKHRATDAAVRLADELGLDLADIEGTGSEGRITVSDVRAAPEP
jgi:e3 binding domain